MAERISRVYTRTGDDGLTGMADGTRVDKSSAVITAIGDVDELNSVIGLLRSESLPDTCEHLMRQVQNDLFSMGGELSMPAYQVIGEQHVLRLELQIDNWNAELEPLKEFILPAGNPAVALCHQARSVCRRAERSIFVLNREHALRPVLLQYINRLSDLLFVSARFIAAQQGVEEVYWQQEGESPQ